MGRNCWHAASDEGGACLDNSPKNSSPITKDAFLCMDIFAQVYLHPSTPKLQRKRISLSSFVLCLYHLVSSTTRNARHECRREVDTVAKKDSYVCPIVMD